MSWHDDMAIQLPRDGGGGGGDDGRDANALRNDIMDELADHLDCAMQRELRETDDEREARRRVLARFGEPARVARRLWLDAMKGRLMAMKISIGLNVLLAVVVVVVVVLMTTEIARSRDMAQMLMVEMQESRDALREAAADRADAPSDWATVEISVIDAESKSPLLEYQASLSGKLLNETDQDSLRETADANGHLTIGPIRPGSHLLSITDKDGQVRRESITVYPLRQQSIEIDWNEFEFGDRSVQFFIKMAEGVTNLLNLRNARGGTDPLTLDLDSVEYLRCYLRPKVDGTNRVDWSWPTFYLVFDGQGRVLRIEEDDPIWFLEDKDWPSALAERSFMDSIELPAGRMYSVSLLEILAPLASTGVLHWYRDRQVAGLEFELDADATDAATWTFALRKHFS